jgi:hypothetical protein
MHAVERRPAASWPAALLPAALALALLTGGMSTTAAGSAQGAPPAPQEATELHVVPAPR